MRLAVFVFLIAFLCSGICAKAQADSSLPAKIQGNWASPDCGQYSEALILSRYFYLKSGKSDISLLPAALSGKGEDFEILSLKGQKHPVRLEEDGILKIAPQLKGGNAWESLDLDGHMEYTGCLEAPTVIPKIIERTMRYIDRIREQCTASLKNDCARVLFKLADANNDKKISLSEIKRTATTAFLLAALAEKGTVPDSESETIAKQSKPDAEAIGKKMIELLDSDASGALDYNEIAQDFQSPDLPVIKKTLLSLGAYFPAFKLAAMGMK